jgi:hypothetical protein
MAVTENLSIEVRQTIEFSAGMMIQEPRDDDSTSKPLPSCDEKGCVLLFLHIPKTGKFGTVPQKQIVHADIYDVLL